MLSIQEFMRQGLPSPSLIALSLGQRSMNGGLQAAEKTRFVQPRDKAHLE